MLSVKIGNITITEAQANAEITRAKRDGRRPTQVYVLAMEKFRSMKMLAANARPAVWNF